MNPTETVRGRVASLHLHPTTGGAPLTATASVTVVADKGIEGEPRFFERGSRRQVSLMAREQIASHATALGLAAIAPGAIRANIETTGVELGAWLDRDVRVGTAVLRFFEMRTGCHQMDAVCEGLRKLTDGNRLGVLATVVQSGYIRVGDEIALAATAVTP
jgi:MOSC domain-containing protein YiiM